MVIAIILGLSFLWFLFCWPRVKRGKVVLAPGEGEIRIYTKFSPLYARAWFVEKCKPGPSCADLQDELYNLQLLDDGFRFSYTIETGVRVVKWMARR